MANYFEKCSAMCPGTYNFFYFELYSYKHAGSPNTEEQRGRAHLEGEHSGG